MGRLWGPSKKSPEPPKLAIVGRSFGVKAVRLDPAWDQITEQALVVAKAARLLPPDATAPLILGPGGPPYPRPPRPLPPGTLAFPDFAAQFNQCLSDDQLLQLEKQIRDELGPYMEIQAECVDGNQNIGVWLEGTSDADVARARREAVKKLAMLDGDIFAFFVGLHLIDVRAQQAFASRPADPFGTHLRSISVGLTPPATVTTTLQGREHITIVPENFTVTVEEKLSAANGTIVITPTARLDADVAALVALAFLGPANNIDWTGQLIGLVLTGVPSGIKGVAAYLAPLLPTQVPASSTTKYMLGYYDPVVTTGGVTFRGWLSQAIPRQPQVVINGPQWLPVALNKRKKPATATGVYSFTASDFSPNSFSWQSDGHINTASSPTTVIDFNVPGDPQPGDVFSYAVRLQAADTNTGLAAPLASIIVTVEIVEIEPTPKPGHGPPHPPRDSRIP